MLALDTDSLGADIGTGPAVFTVGAALGYRAFTLGARHAGVAPDEIVPTLRRGKLRVVAVRGPEVELPGDRRVPAAALLAAPEADRRKPATERLQVAMLLAARLSARALVLDLGDLPLIPEAPGVDEARRREISRDHALDLVLPVLFDLTRVCPEVPLAVSVPAGVAGWPDPETLEILVAELRGRRVGWWYDTARAHRYAQATEVSPAPHVPPPAWLDRSIGDPLGVTLADVGGDEQGLPLGAGEVDFGVLRGLGAGDTVWSVRVDPAYGTGAVREAAAFAEGME